MRPSRNGVISGIQRPLGVGVVESVMMPFCWLGVPAEGTCGNEKTPSEAGGVLLILTVKR